jgi:hypothetical protein
MNIPSFEDRLDVLAFQTASIGWVFLIVGAIVKFSIGGGKTSPRSVSGRLSFWLIAPGAVQIAIAAAILAVGLMVDIYINNDPHNNLLPFYATMLMVFVVAAPILPIHLTAELLLPDGNRDSSGAYMAAMAVLDSFLWVAIFLAGQAIVAKALSIRASRSG